MAFMLLTPIFRNATIDERSENALIAHPREIRPASAGALRSALPRRSARAQSAVADGQKLAFDRGKGNCLTCHVIKGGDLPGTIGPELKDIKARYDRNELVAIIIDETKRNPLT